LRHCFRLPRAIVRNVTEPLAGKTRIEEPLRRVLPSLRFLAMCRAAGEFCALAFRTAGSSPVRLEKALCRPLNHTLALRKSSGLHCGLGFPSNGLSKPPRPVCFFAPGHNFRRGAPDRALPYLGNFDPGLEIRLHLWDRLDLLDEERLPIGVGARYCIGSVPERPRKRTLDRREFRI